MERKKQFRFWHRVAAIVGGLLSQGVRVQSRRVELPPCSETTAWRIGAAAREIACTLFAGATAILTDSRDVPERAAAALFAEEALTEEKHDDCARDFKSATEPVAAL